MQEAMKLKYGDSDNIRAQFGRLNYPLLALLFLIPLQNIYIGKIPKLGYGVNALNMLLVLSFLYSLIISRGRLTSPISIFVGLMIIQYTIQLINASLHPAENSNITSDLSLFKDVMFPYMLYFVALRSCQSINQIKYYMAATILPLPYMFRVFYTNLSWMGFSKYSDKLRLNNGTFMELGSNEIAAFYASYMFIVFALASSSKKRWLKWGLYIIGGMNVYCVIFSFSRGAYLSALGGLVVYLIAAKKKKLLAVAACVLLVTTWIGVPMVPPAVIDRLSSIGTPYEELDESAKSRVVLWEYSYKCFTEHPVLGIGFHKFALMNPLKKDTHNYYVKMLVEGGLLGLGIFLVFLGACFYCSLRGRNIATSPFISTISSGLLACVVAIVIGNFFGDRFSHYPLISYFYCYLAFIGAALRASVGDSRRCVENV